MFLMKIMNDLKYNNIVCSGLYSVKLNLDILEPQLSNVIKRKSSLVWKCRKLPFTCTVYKCGKLILLCNPKKVFTDMDECQRFGHTTLQSYARIIHSKIVRGQLLNVKLETVTATYDFGFQIKFSELYKNIVGSYEPEFFPGFMIKRHNIHFNVFTSGKMVCVGLKTSDDVITIVQPLICEIELFMYTKE